MKNRRQMFIRCITFSSFCFFLFGFSGYAQTLPGNFSNQFLKTSESSADSTIIYNYSSPRGAAVRSLVLPGWGQWYNKRYRKSGLFVVTEGVFLYGIMHSHSKFKSTGKISYREQKNTLQWWLAVIMLLSVTDAYVDAYLSDFSEQMEISGSGEKNTLFLLKLSLNIF